MRVMLPQVGGPMLWSILFSFWMMPSGRSVLAYGTEGHRIVANLAWYLLPKHIKDEIYELLDEAKVGYFCKDDAWCIFLFVC